MHRLKLIGLLVFLVVGLSLASYVVVRNDFGPRIQEAVAADLTKTQMQVQALKFARVERLKKVAGWLTEEPRLNLARALREPTDQARHKLATDAIQQIVPLLQEKQRLDYKPDVILVISPTGKVVARWRFANLSGEQLAFPLLKRVVENRTRDDDVWKFREQNERMMTAVAAPILDGVKVVGVLALLYEHSNQMALDDRRTFKTEVAYFVDDKLYGSSLQEPGQQKQLVEFLGPHQKALQEGKIIGPSPIDVGGRKYIALAAGFADRPGGFMLFRSLDEALAPVSAFLGRFPLIAGGFLIVAILLALLILRSVTAPYERLEHGVMDIVAGNQDTKFDPHLPGSAGALAHGLNLLVAQLMGRPPPDREPEDQAWADPFFVEDLSAEEIRAHKWDQLAEHRHHLDSQMGLTLGYYEKLFAEYMKARQRAGEKQTDSISVDQFIEKVRKNEEVLRAKYHCAIVKFEVLVKEGKVTLKPVPIR